MQKFTIKFQLNHISKIFSKNDSLLVTVISCDDDDGFGVEGADGVDVPDVDAVADVHGTPSFKIILPPLRP